LDWIIARPLWSTVNLTFCTASRCGNDIVEEAQLITYVHYMFCMLENDAKEDCLETYWW